LDKNAADLFDLEDLEELEELTVLAVLAVLAVEDEEARTSTPVTTHLNIPNSPSSGFERIRKDPMESRWIVVRSLLSSFFTSSDEMSVNHVFLFMMYTLSLQFDRFFEQSFTFFNAYVPPTFKQGRALGNREIVLPRFVLLLT
jgi:hypothetical protein